MRKKLLVVIVFIWACTAFASDYTIDNFSTSQKSIPPASNGILESKGGGTLVKVSVKVRLKSGEIILRRKFGTSDYCLYKGRMTQSALSGEANLSAFSFPGGMKRSDALRQKYYTEKSINPEQDISNVYCDNTNLYVQQARAIYWNKNGQWNELTASDLKVDKSKAKTTGTISVSSTPQGAQIVIDGKNKGRTNGYIDGIFPGEHTISVELEGYQKSVQKITVKSTDDLPQYSFTLVSALGALSIHSNPVGAVVMVRGEKKGVTPLQLFNVPLGRYPIRLEQEWYLPATDTVMVTMNETTSVVKELAPDFGSVSVTSSPEGARIVIDGVDRGATPVNISRQPPGTFKVSAQADMYKRADTVLTVKRGTSVKLNVLLKPDFGTLALSGIPDGCAYQVDGKDMIDSTIRLSPGKHHITMDGRGKYSSIDTMIDIADGVKKKFSGVSQRLTGSVQVRPIPLDAEIFLDGESKGIGGKTLRDIPTGVHSVSALKQGYLLTKQDVEIKTGEVQVVKLNLSQTSPLRQQKP